MNILFQYILKINKQLQNFHNICNNKNIFMIKMVVTNFIIVTGVRENPGRVPQGHAVPSNVPRRRIRGRPAVPAVH